MKLNVTSTDKGHVVEHVAQLTGEFEGTTVVRLDMKELGERRYRLRTVEGSEARVTVATNRHCQETRNHRTPGVYQVDKGWIACVTKNVAGELVVDMAFANSDWFYVPVPANTDYVIVMSGPATYVYMTNDKKASKPKKDDFYLQVAAMSDEELLRRYSERKCIASHLAKTLADQSFESQLQ